MKNKAENLSQVSAGIFRKRILPLIGAFVVLAVSLLVLFWGDNVGLSDNGDFARVITPNNISYADDTDHYYLFKEDYVMDLHNAGSLPSAMREAWKGSNEDMYYSPHFLIVKLSKEMNVIANALSGKALTAYNIKYLSFIYVLMLSIASWIIFTFFAEYKPRLQIAIFVLFVFIFCDAGYLLYFNSFYGEPLQYTSLMLLIALGMLIYKRPTAPKVVAFFVALYFFAGSKLANIPYSIIVALLAIVIVLMRKGIKFRIGVVLSVLMCIVCMGSLYFSIPGWMDRDTTYQSVFLGVIKDSKTPERDLESLGTRGDYAVLAGTHAYMEDDEYPIDIHTDEFKASFYDKVSKLDIAVFYAKHPARLFWELCNAIENSAYIRPPVVGNSETVRMEFTNKFSLWSNLRVFLKFLYTPWVIFTAFALITVYMLFINIFYIHNHRIESPGRLYMICALDVLILGLWINLILPIIANGEGDLAKHMFLFTNCIDIVFFAILAWILSMPLKKLLAYTGALAVFTALFHIHMPKSTLEFGTFNGDPITWEVVNKFDDGTALIMAKEPITQMPFDDTSNSWEDSSLRKWLNEDFMDGFSAYERSKIVRVKNSIMLSYKDRAKAEQGNHAHYWNFTRALVADMASTAYSYYVEDYVYLPSLDMLKTIDTPSAYWILCPYTSNDFMQRFMNSDGFILHTEVENTKGVRPVIRVRTAQ